MPKRVEDLFHRFPGAFSVFGVLDPDAPVGCRILASAAVIEFPLGAREGADAMAFAIMRDPSKGG